jgi:hypothetical protein
MSMLLAYSLISASSLTADYDQATGKAFWNHVRSWLMGKKNHLINFDEYMAMRRTAHRQDIGIMIVPIDQIVGSIGRTHDFDCQFMPRTNRTQFR